MKPEYHFNIYQGTEEWFEMRRGILTASEMKLILTPTLKVAKNDKTRAHVYELAAQRITGYCDDVYQSWDMERGHIEEGLGRDIYNEHYESVKECGFVVSRTFGLKIGYSPDGLVGEDGLIECKGRIQKHQVATIVSDELPKEYLLQIQTGLLVTQRQWCDFISYSNGMHMYVKRIYPDVKVQKAIVEAAKDFEGEIVAAVDKYNENSKGLQVVERIDYQCGEGFVSSSDEVMA